MNGIKAWHTFRLLLCKDGYARAQYIKKHDLFGHMGNNCYFHYEEIFAIGDCQC